MKIEKPILDIITDRLTTMMQDDSKRTIRREFKMTMEQLQDEPQKAMETIIEYLLEHMDKIEDFSFDSYIEPSTFAPVLVMNIRPIPEMRNHIVVDHWTKLTDVASTAFDVLDKSDKKP